MALPFTPTFSTEVGPVAAPANYAGAADLCMPGHARSEPFVPAVTWTFDPEAILKHPDTPPEHRFPGGSVPPTMAPEQLGAFAYINRFIRGEFRKPKPPDLDYHEWRERLHGRVLILTGRAGSGKTTVINWLRACNPSAFSASATTASAALLVGGTTIDMLFCFKRSNWELRSQFLPKRMKEVAKNIIVDEASMMGESMASCVTKVLDLYPDRHLILVGDWAQAMPVKERWPFGTLLFKSAHLVMLNGCYRQSDTEYLEALEQVRNGRMSEYFRKCMGDPGDVDDKHIFMFATNNSANRRNEEKYRELRDAAPVNDPERTLVAGLKIRDGYKGPFVDPAPGALYPDKEKQLYETSRMANNLKICKGARVLITRNAPIAGGVRAFVNGDLGEVVGITSDTAVDVLELDVGTGTDDEIEDAVNAVINEMRVVAGKQLEYDRAAQANIEVTRHGLIQAARKKYLQEESASDVMDDNGQKVRPQWANFVAVRLDRTGHVVLIPQMVAEIYDPTIPGGGVQDHSVEITGYPLRLGWAVTIHKTQGMTLPAAYADLSTILYMPSEGRHGLCYVALSRTPDASKLVIDDVSDSYAYLDPATQGIVNPNKEFSDVE